MVTNQSFVDALFQHVLLRPADVSSQNFYVERLDLGLATRAQILETFLASPEIVTLPTGLAGIYQAVLGRQPDKGGLQFWSGVHRDGANFTQIAQQMVNSVEFKQKYASLTTPETVINQIYLNGLGREADAPGLAYWVNELTRGADMGAVAASIALSPEAKARNEAAMKKTLAWHAVIGDEPTTDELAALPDGASAMAVAIMQQPEAPTSGGDFWELSTTLYGATAITGPLNVDMTTNSLTMAGSPQSLFSGSLPGVMNVDFSALTVADGVESEPGIPLVSILADDADNRLVGSDLGNSFDAGRGQDKLTMGRSVDVVMFADSANANGLDVIDRFTLGTDLLNFSRFLNKTKGVVNLVSVDANKGFESAWSSGDLLVVNGFGLDTPQAVANLFGTGKPLASPSGLNKAVVMTASISGDAKLWFVVNETDLGRITANEVQQVATLTGINNLLEQATLDSLRASVSVSVAPSVVAYSAGGLVESLKNDGSIDSSLTVSIVGDSFTGAIGAAIGEVSNVPAGLRAKLVKVSNTEAVLTLTGKATSHSSLDSLSNLTVSFVEDNFLSGLLPLNAVNEELTLDFVDVFMVENGGLLTVSGGVPGALTIDLAKDTAMMGNAPILPLTGAIANANFVDLSAVTNTTATALLTVSGSASNEVFSAAPMGGSLRGAGGVDGYLLGTGVDKIVFEASATANGVDVVGGGSQTNFKIGTGGDVLDFSQFLNVTGKTNITTRSADSSGAIAWTNGQVLVVQGDSIDSSAEVAALFGAGSVFAAPTAQAKAVVIAADLVGDASVWYVTNKSNVTSIDVSEVEQVAVLTGINNVSLLPFVATNFA